MNYRRGDYNTAYILDKFNQVKLSDAKYVLIQLNIKNFRYYNTKCGIEKGNEILELVFDQLQYFCVDGEYAGHLYADNFALLATYEDLEVLSRTRLVALIDKLYRMEESSISRNLFFSVGIYPIEDAKIEFYEAWNYANLCRKESEELQHRFSSVEVFAENLCKRYMERVDLEIRTAEAYKNYEFISYLQPKIDLKTETIVGAEALLRWIDEDGNSVPLYKFLPILNRNSYIVLVDLDIFDQRCKHLDERIKQGKKVVPISFNISNAHFYDPDVLQDYVTIFEKYKIPKEYIGMEFMESISLNDTEHMKKVISGFKEYGFTCLLDDFGNGYSSFNVLLNAPLDIIKMDRQFFLDNLKGDGKLVIKTIIELIHSLNLKVVAEGVEQKEHIEFLKECDCDYVQGYYYYKPMEIEKFDMLLDQI